MNGIYLINIGINFWFFLFFESIFLKIMNAECILIDKISIDFEKDFLKKWKIEFYLRDY